MIEPAPSGFSVSSVEFVSGALATAAVFHRLPGATVRRGVWALGSAAAVWLTVPDLRSLLALSAFLLSGFAAARALSARPSRAVLAGYLTALVAAFAVLKDYAVVGLLLPRPIRLVGLSYMLFRQIHLVVDASQGQIEDLSLGSFLVYQLNPLTLLAGPIQRYQDFAAQWRELSPALPDERALLDDCRRLLWGVVKIALIAPFFYLAWDELQKTLLRGRVMGWRYTTEFAAVFTFYPAYLYSNFSGYSDIVISIARLLGMSLPENFDRPWLARDVIEFWTRWHITLGTWIRDYLFMPMFKPAVERSPETAARRVWLFYFIAFALAGAWHGTTLNFLLYGVWQGLGLSINKLYETRLIRRLGREGYKKYLADPRIRAAAVAANLIFQGVSLLIFSQRSALDAGLLMKGLFRRPRLA